MSRLAPILSFVLLVASIAAAATLVLWSVLAQWPHWSRYGEPLAWFNVGYGLEWLGLDLGWVDVCRTDPAWQEVHRVVAWVLDVNLTIGVLTLAVVLVPVSVRVANGLERALLPSGAHR
ncbi:hypothetical protein [Azospirillum sp. TSO22-1]|uniref:hypothetical protein n=1 Tax=Azospirillum sp. TSO22-1 TaxID=716789 RepID=UPI000D60647F|nr:hypothetical protein [Azospirillum sp. TSO22-1]PWC44932.1 hypothetical protein TSO221_16415 [Azospirillum sp. TSO22-1]